MSDALASYRKQYTYYAQRLLADLGLTEVEQPLRSELLAGIEHYINVVITNVILANLKEPQLTQIQSDLDRGQSQGEIVARLAGTMPDIEIKIADALAEAYDQLLSESRQLSHALVQPKSSGNTEDQSSSPTN